MNDDFYCSYSAKGGMRGAMKCLTISIEGGHPVLEYSIQNNFDMPAETGRCEVSEEAVEMLEHILAEHTHDPRESMNDHDMIVLDAPTIAVCIISGGQELRVSSEGFLGGAREIAGEVRSVMKGCLPDGVRI